MLQRQKGRPKHPDSPEFNLQHDAIPSRFLRMDRMVDGQRILAFATDAQYSLLAKCKNWFVDGTFKVSGFKKLIVL